MHEPKLMHPFLAITNQMLNNSVSSQIKIFKALCLDCRAREKEKLFPVVGEFYNLQLLFTRILSFLSLDLIIIKFARK